ncbi:ABC transporter permease [Oenococcus oeni]
MQAIRQEFFKYFHRLNYLVYSLIIFFTPILAMIAYLLADPSHAEVDFVYHHGYFDAFIFIFMLVSFGSTLAEEFQFDTIKVIVSRGDSRMIIFFAKIIKLLFDYVLWYLLAVASYLLCWLIVFSGKDFGKSITVANKGLVFVSSGHGEITYIWENFVTYLLYIFLIGSIALMLSSLLKSNSIAIASAFIIWLGGSIVSSLLSAFLYKHFHLIKWNPFNVSTYIQLQVFDGSKAMAQLSHISQTGIISASIIWTLIFFTIAGVVFNRRNL